MIFINIAKYPVELFPILSVWKAPAATCEGDPPRPLPPCKMQCCFRFWLLGPGVFQGSTLWWTTGLTDSTKTSWNRGATDSRGGFLCVAVKFRAATSRDSPSTIVFSELYVATVVHKQKHQLIIRLMPWKVVLLNADTGGVTSVSELVAEALFVISGEK